MSVRFNIKRIIISRTDAIGDVILTFPLCGIIKQHYPDAVLLFMGRGYTQPVINCCKHVDEFINADELLGKEKSEILLQFANLNADVIIHVFPQKEIAKLAKQVGIKYRIGTTNRLIHWGTVNKLVRLSRKNSKFHESQLNCKLLEPLGIYELPNIKEMARYTGFSKIPELPGNYFQLLDKKKIRVILHPKSNASAREWELGNYTALIHLLPQERFQVFISGTENEKATISDWIKSLPSHVTDISGKFILKDFIAFISQVDYLVAASTGPLHIAAAAGIGAIGLFPNIRPMNAVRWQAIGLKAISLSTHQVCFDCNKNPGHCHCINEITPAQVAALMGV
jgi:heptosyltransferase-3